MRSLVEHAILAPSSHNTQPWRFRLGQAHVDVLADRTRALPANDPDHRELVISCGCALMSLRSAAAGRGVATEVELLPDPDDPDWLARVSVAKPAAAPSEAELAPFLPRRRTCRRPFATREVDAAVATKLADAARAEAAWLRPITTSPARREVAGLVAEGDAVQWANPAWRRELAEWIRPRSRGDGLTVPALVAPFARFAVRAADMGARVGARDRSLAEASPLLAVLGTVDDDARAWLVAGQALQRVLLTACAFGLQASHLNQPIQVASLRPRLQQLVGAEFPQIVIRLGYSDAKVAPVPRRPVAEVIDDRP